MEKDLTLTLSEKLKKILENDFFYVYDGGHGSNDRETVLNTIDDAIEVLDFLRKKIEPDVSSSCSSSSPSFESPLSEQDMKDPLTNSSGQGFLENDFYDGGSGSKDRETVMEAIDDAIEVPDFLRKGEWKKIEPDVSSSPSFESPLSEQDMIDPLTNSSGQRFLENDFYDGGSGSKDRGTTIEDAIQVLDFLRKGKWKKIEPHVPLSSSFEDPLSKQCIEDPLIISSGQRLKKIMGEDRETLLKLINEDIGVLDFFRKGKWKKIEPHDVSSSSSPWFEGPLSKHYMIDPLMISSGQRLNKKILAEDFRSKDSETVLKTIDEAIGVLNFLKKIEFDVPLSSSSSSAFEDASNLMIRNISFDLCDLPVDFLAVEIVKKLDVNDVRSMKEVCHKWLEFAKDFSTRPTLRRRIVTLIYGKLTIYNLNKVRRGQSKVCKSSFSGWKIIGSVGSWVLLSKGSLLNLYRVSLDSLTELPKLPVGTKPLFSAFSDKPTNTSSVLFLFCSVKTHVVLLKLLNGDTIWRMIRINGLNCDARYLNSMHLLNGELHIHGDNFDVSFNPLQPNELIRRRAGINISNPPPYLAHVLKLPNNSLTLLHGTVLSFDKLSFAMIKRGRGRNHHTAAWIDLEEKGEEEHKLGIMTHSYWFL